MSIISKYLMKTISYYLLLVIVFLLGLQILIEFTREFADLGVGTYDLYHASLYVLLMLPYDLYQFFPMASLLGVMIALSLLATHSEIVVMRAAGLSLVNISSTIVALGLIFILAMTLVGEVLSPMSYHKAEKIKAEAMGGGRLALTREGIWLKGEGEVINIKSISGKKLHDITIYESGDNIALNSLGYAKSGSYITGNWYFKDLVVTEFGASKLGVVNIGQKLAKINFSPKLIGLKYLDSDQKNIIALKTYINYRLSSGLDASRFLVDFWQRVFLPLATLVMILLAIPFVFGVARSSTMGFKMVSGIVVGFAFYMLHQFVGPMSVVYQLPPILAALLPSLVFAILGVFLLLRVR